MVQILINIDNLSTIFSRKKNIIFKPWMLGLLESSKNQFLAPYLFFLTNIATILWISLLLFAKTSFDDQRD